MQRQSIAPYRFVAFFAVLFVTTLGVRVAHADPRTEKEAKDLRQKAIEEDSLGLQYSAAIEKLEQAVTKCGADKCNKGLRAQLYQDLGAMHYNNKEKDKALQALTNAAKIDATLALSRDYRTPELDELWGEAKKRAGGGTVTEPGPVTSADWEHTAAPEQQANTPLPIFAKYKGEEKLVKVLIRYKGGAMGELASATMLKKGEGWAGTIPCKDVTEGTLIYYLRAENDAGDQVKLGDPDHPFKVAIKPDKVENPPRLPGEEPPQTCACPPDAPPDFPGCAKKVDPNEPTGKDEGAECDEDSECKSKTCKKHSCTAPSSSSKFRRVWIGVSGSLDLALLPSADDVCKLLDPQATPQNSAGYYCVDPNNGNADYPSRKDPTQNKNIQVGQSDQVKGGMAPGNIRLALSFDYAVTQNLLIGARAGYVINTYPGTAAATDAKGFTTPVHLELRGTYLIGQDALSKPGLAPMVFLGAGIGEFDAKVSVTVVEAGANGSRAVDAWLPNGPIFVSVGGGIRYAFSNAVGVMLAGKFTGSFGSNGFLPSLAPELGLHFGF